VFMNVSDADHCEVKQGSLSFIVCNAEDQCNFVTLSQVFNILVVNQATNIVLFAVI